MTKFDESNQEVSEISVKTEQGIRMVSVFDYSDFRKFIRDRFEMLRSEREGFSHRRFTRLAGFSSPSVLSGLIEGRRGLSDEGAKKVSKGLKLNAIESEYFILLVKLGNARTSSERDEILETIRRSKRLSKRRLLAVAEYSYGRQWFYPVVRELIAMGISSVDDLKHSILFEISSSDLERCLNDLQLLKLVEIKYDRLCVTENLVMTTQECPSETLVQYHKSLIHKSLEALDTFDRDQRDFKAATISISMEALPQIKKELYRFLTYLVKKYEGTDSHSKAVLQLNTQAFLLAKR